MARSQPRKDEPAAAAPDPRDAFQDRDLSWLEFNRRVLHEALDDRNPLLERLKFLAIFASNLDEFFMKRIEIISRKAGRGSNRNEPTASSRATIDRIRQTLLPMLEEQAACFRTLVSALAQKGVRLLSWSELTEEQITEARAYFDSFVFPVLTPLALDPTHPFPFLSNLSTSLGVILRNPDLGELCFARIKVPNTLPPWVGLRSVSHDEHVYMRLHDLIQQNLDRIFPGMEVVESTLFRVTRDAEVEQNEDITDLREQVVEELKQRRFEPVVRLEFAAKPHTWVRDLLVRKFNLTEDDVYEMPGELDHTGLFAIATLPRPDLRDPPWSPLEPAMLPDPEADLFAAIRAGDILVHHPYESFDSSVERFISNAADDPQVRAIKMTVYRVGDDTPFVRSLVRAAEAGKQVVCLIEVRARFDEARNLHWADMLDRVGAHVVYGVLGLKTHTKLALIVREEANGIRCYAHVGTGNYHVKTARLYTDLGLFTCEKVLTDDIVNLFHFLTGYSRKSDYQKLLVSPVTMRARFIAMIEREIEHQKAGRPARIVAKMNQLEDRDLCEVLIRASQAGVPIDLIVRGFCCLRPGLAGLTQSIRITSIIGRFLEHSRLFYFANGSDDPLDGVFLLGSADWMYRNLSSRVEAIAPVEVRALKQRLWEILDINLRDQRQAWDMQADGSYVQRRSAPRGDDVAAQGSHVTLMNLTRRRVQGPQASA